MSEGETDFTSLTFVCFCFSAPESSGSSPGLSEVKQSLLCMCACVSVFYYGLICWQCAGVALQQQNLLTHTRCLLCRLWNHCAELLFSLNLDHPIRTVTELWLTVMNARPLPSALLARAEHARQIRRHFINTNSEETNKDKLNCFIHLQHDPLTQRKISSFFTQLTVCVGVLGILYVMGSKCAHKDSSTSKFWPIGDILWSPWGKQINKQQRINQSV